METKVYFITGASSGIGESLGMLDGSQLLLWFGAASFLKSIVLVFHLTH